MYESPLDIYYRRHLEQGGWAELDRAQLLPLLAGLMLRWTRLIRLEDKRVWEIYFDLSTAPTPEMRALLADTFRNDFSNVVSPRIVVVTHAEGLPNCAPSEMVIGFLIAEEW